MLVVEMIGGMSVLEGTSGVVMFLVVNIRVDVVSRWGGRHGLDVLVVDGLTVELSVMGDSRMVVVSAGDSGDTVGLVVAGGPMEVVDVSGTSGGAVVEVFVVLCVGAADQEVLSVYAVEGSDVASVTFDGGDTVLVVVAPDVSETAGTGAVTFFVVTDSGEVGTGVVGATWTGVDGGNSGTGVVEVTSSVGGVCSVFSVVTMETSGAVVLGLVRTVVLRVVKGATGVTDSVVLAEVTVGKETVPVSAGGKGGPGEKVVAAVLGKPGGTDVVVVGGVLSTVAVVSVCAAVVVLGNVVLSVVAGLSG